MLDDLLQQQLAFSGGFHIVPIPDALQQEIAHGPGIANCNGCQRDYAQRAGADWAARSTSQKVSNLILNINLYMEDGRTGKLQFGKSVDIRGNTDESWSRLLTSKLPISATLRGFAGTLAQIRIFAMRLRRRLTRDSIGLKMLLLFAPQLPFATDKILNFK